MLTLLRTDLLDYRRLWVGVFVVILTASIAAALPAALIDTALHSPDLIKLGLLALASTVIVLTTVSLNVVLTATVRTLIELRRRTFALWLITGMTPQQVATVFLGELGATAFAAATLGTVLALTFAPALLESLLIGSAGLESVHITLSAGSAALGALITVAVVVIAATSQAREAGRTPVLALLRNDQHRPPRTLPRLILAVPLLTLVGFMIGGLPAALPNGAAQSVLVGPILIAVAALTAPLYIPRLIALWTAIIPTQASTSWHLARASATATARRSTASIVSFVVAIGLPWTFLVGQQTAATAIPGATPLDPRPLALLLGGPTILAAVGAAAGIYMAIATRKNQEQLLTVIGASRTTRVLTVAAEPIIYVVTAALTCTLVAGLLALTETLILRTVSETVQPELAGAVFATLLGGCIVLALTATAGGRQI